ncbi:MAG: DUF5074 domain-containing protein [Bacteroidia bacterium]|nr:DUF5074 domain-containing protein [Bacteroidia bacterium]
MKIKTVSKKSDYSLFLSFILFFAFFSGILFFFNSCKKYPIGPQPVNPGQTDTSKKNEGVFIVCEGNYGARNGSLSYYDFKTKIVSENIFFNVNARLLGDVPQSMVIKDSIGYIIVNHSDKIEVIHTNTIKSKGTISNLNSPRYMIFINNSKAYISSLTSTSLQIINPATLQITGQINAGYTTEKMLKYNDLVFAVNWSNGSRVIVINSLSDQVIQTIPVVKEPNSIVLDKNNNIWVLCSGGSIQNNHYIHDTYAALQKINPVGYHVEQTLTFSDIQAMPTKLCINKTGDTLYYLNNSIYRINIDDQTLPSQPVVLAKSRIFYGLAVHSETSYIYASNAVDYAQPGWIYRFRPDGSAIDSFKVDINPGEFCFK